MTNRALLCVFVVGLAAITPQEKKEYRIYTVSGTGWKSCRDWQASSDSFKYGYVMGRWEANAQIAQILGDIPEARPVKDAFEPRNRGWAWGDYVRGLRKRSG